MKQNITLKEYQTKKTLEKIRQILTDEIKPYWERNQDLHNTAYEIVERMIKKEFDPEVYDIHHVDVDNEEVYFDYDFSEPSYVIGYISFLQKICSWRKPKDSFLPLHLEVEYIIKCKEKKIMKLIKESVFDEKTTFENCMYRYI